MATLTDLARRIAQDIKPLRYDSGPRNVSQAFLSAFTSATNNATVQRVGSRVTFNLYVRQFDKAGAPTGTVLFTLPTGFRPRATYRVAAVSPSGSEITVATNGSVTLHGGAIPSGAYVTFNFGHLTNDPPPATPPGSPA